MSIFHRTPALRWIVPAAAAALIIGGGAAIGTLTADAAATPLPARSAAQLVADVHSSALTGLSGTVVQTSDLGIPDLPSIGTAPLLGGLGSSDLSSLISGTHTLRVWYAGPQKIRVALLGSLGESDIIRNGTDLWTWSSTSNTATHRTLPADRPAKGGHQAVTGPLATGLPANPQQAADEALKALSPSTKVSTDPGVTVAGRSAYELVLQPKDSRSLVASVRIAIDSATHVPLRVQVYAKGHQDPAFAVGFTSVDFSRPDAAEFDFNPPPGATVDQAGRQNGPTTRSNPDGAHGPGALQSGAPTAPTGPLAPSQLGSHAVKAMRATKVVGTGWTSVLVTDEQAGLGALTGGSAAQGQDGKHIASGGDLVRVLAALPQVSGSWGSGRLLRSTLFSAVITNDGRVAVGAVTPDLLYAALGSS